MDSEIKKLDPREEYFFREGCHIIEVSNSPNDKELSIARARVEPGRTTAWHQLKGTCERYVILQGSGEVEIGDVPKTHVAEGDTVIIPPQTPQRIHNSGFCDLVFLAICSPRFQIENYEDLEPT
ncbi:MAG: cupin domain-containing protein [Pseudohongiellaceae bacterium]